MFRSDIQYVGGTKEEADYVYLNCDVVNERLSDLTLGVVNPDPVLRYNETRDSAVINDASAYYFSIIRFTLNGPNRNLPLWIPEILENQPNPDLTAYAISITYQQTWNTSLGPIQITAVPNPSFLIYTPETQNPVLAPPPLPPIPNQDISTRYYWGYTYQHFVNLVNAGYAQAMLQTWLAFQAAWLAAGLVAPADPFPYPTFAAFTAAIAVPQMVYNPDTKRFTIYADSDAFGDRLLAFVPQPYNPGPPGIVGPQTPPQCRMFFNSNMFNLFAGFENDYYNTPAIVGLGPVPAGYVNEIIFTNKFYTNVADYRLPPQSGVPPLGYVPLAQQKAYWINTQETQSTDTLWSPISAIVFTSTLIPVRAEQTGVPVVLGENNIGTSTATSQSAFQPIITDISLPLGGEGAESYRSMIYYVPSAEYRLADLGASKQDVRNIDIQCFWKCRLNNELYPISIPNGGSASFKIMFKHRRTLTGKY